MRTSHFQWRRLQQYIPYAGVPTAGGLRLPAGLSPSLHRTTVQQFGNGNDVAPV
jgi:hypothetical protein